MTLLIDVPFLCHRAYHTTGELEHVGVRTGTVFGVLREVLNLRERFRTDDFVFAFDEPGPHGLHRAAEFPGYKGNRKDKSHFAGQADHAYKKHREQILRLRNEMLYDLGYENVFSYPGFEADDVIAGACENEDVVGDCTVVSADKDLYQLLERDDGEGGREVTQWTPLNGGKAVTCDSFTAEYKVGPGDWPTVKAIAGCLTDSIPGVPGVGEITAAKYVRGVLPQTNKLWHAIERDKPLWQARERLTRLPWPGMPDLAYRGPQDTDPGDWDKVLRRFGMVSLLKKV